jgi:predicted TIM-barrel fold metal-dependent hydrolase
MMKLNRPRLLKTVAVLFIVTVSFMISSHYGYCRPIDQNPFQRDDRNNDGRLSRKEFKGMLPAFNKIDKDGDGFVSYEEFQQRGEGGFETKTRYERVFDISKADQPLNYIDTHQHLAGWVSSGDSLSDGFEKAAEVALNKMNELGIKIMIIMPTPQPAIQDNPNDIGDYLNIVERYPDRFRMLAGGGTLNVMIQQAFVDGEVSTQAREKFEKTAEELLEKGALGFGEMTAEHLSMNPQHPYIAAPPDHPLFLLLADIAAKHNVPIDIHMEAIPQDMPLPRRLRQMANNPEILSANISAFERLLDHNPEAKIIWVHAGWDNTGYRTTQLSDRLLQDHPNLYMSIRVVPKNIPSRPIDEDGRIKTDWLNLVIKYQDRFLIGSDEFFMPHTRGEGHASGGSTEETISFLSQLPFDVAQKVGYENAIQLFRIKE